MPCYSPLEGFRSKTVGSNGKRPIVFNAKDGYRDRPVQLPCGQCIGCRLERSRQWAIRCVHEASLYENNCFITLTYRTPPAGNSLHLPDFQKFMKRLRKAKSQTIRFYHCGEYGEKLDRPHYHALLFNYRPDDLKLFKMTGKNQDTPLYRSEELERLWTFGHSSVGDVTFESAAYTARYIMKKQTGEHSQNHYEWIDPETGEVHDRQPEYTTMSRRPGIGLPWLKKYETDVYPDDFIVLNNQKIKPPKAYDNYHEAQDEKSLGKIKAARIRQAKNHSDNNTVDRLKVRETVQHARLGLLPRKDF